MALSPVTLDREFGKFKETASGKTAVRITNEPGEPIDVAFAAGAGSATEKNQVATDGATALQTITDTQFEVTPVAGQISVTIANIAGGSLFYYLVTGVSTSNAFINVGDLLVLKEYKDSVFLIRAAAGSGSVQIDRTSSP